MNGEQSSRYFNFSPPSFEEWVSQGPRALPIPEHNIFANLPNPAGGVVVDLDFVDVDND